MSIKLDDLTYWLKKFYNKIMSNLTKIEHYVPQVYLNNFCKEQIKNKFLIWKYDKEKCLFSKVNISDVCVQNFFYDIKKSEIQEYAQTMEDDKLIDFPNSILNEDQPLEKFFSVYVEGELFNKIKKIINLYNENKEDLRKLDKLRISDEDLFYCSLYSQYQWLRTPDMKQSLDKVGEDANKGILEILDSYTGDQKDTEQIRKEIKFSETKLAKKRTHHEILFDAKHMTGMANIFYHMYKWIFLYSQDHLFLTSDNPTIFDGYYSPKNIPLFFPLTPNICVALIHEDDKKNYEKYDNGSFVKCSYDCVKYINMLTFHNANKIVLSSINNDDDIKKTLFN